MVLIIIVQDLFVIKHHTHEIAYVGQSLGRLFEQFNMLSDRVVWLDSNWVYFAFVDLSDL